MVLRHARWPTLCAVLGLLSTPVPGAARQHPQRAAASAIPVRYVEGAVHGFLRLTTADGKWLADGDLVQVVHDSAVESRMVFAFSDSSVFEETVTFTQRQVFTMLAYHLLQRGPAFGMDIDATLAQSGDYQVTTASHPAGKQQHYSGKLSLPADVYSGMITTIAKNLSVGAPTTVHLVAFTPKPRLIGLELTGASAPPTLVGRHAERTVVFTLKPRLGPFVHLFASLLGRMPPDSHVWIVTEGGPAFVRFEGPMYLGPVWRLELTSPETTAASPGR
ncbi:MAG: hypothetical protein ABR998_01240 [Gemmatimonadales bacterium]|jgi:hypothetical protein